MRVRINVRWSFRLCRSDLSLRLASLLLHALGMAHDSPMSLVVAERCRDGSYILPPKSCCLLPHALQLLCLQGMAQCPPTRASLTKPHTNRTITPTKLWVDSERSCMTCILRYPHVIRCVLALLHRFCVFGQDW